MGASEGAEGAVDGPRVAAAGVASAGARPGAVGRLDAALERLLALAGEEPARDLARRFDAVRRFLLIAVAAESWNALRYAAYQDDRILQTAIAVVQLGCLALGWPARRGRAACALSAIALSASVALAFPFNANHQAVEVLCLAFVALAAPGSDEARRASLRAIRWVAVLVLFWAGAQKVLWGTYFGGEFLAWRISVDPGFAEVFRFVLPDAEWRRLLALEAVPGSGPYRVDAPLFRLASNASWAAEVVLAPLLLWKPTHRLAAVAAVAFLVAVELAARELFFGALQLFLLTLFLGGSAPARALPWLAAGYAYLFAMAVGWLPHWSFG